jgi:hypothetical protein
MKRINYARVLLGGLLAGVLLFLADGFIHEKLLHGYWMEAMKAAGRDMAAEQQHGGGLGYFAIFELLRGLAMAWVYAVFRAHFGAGPGTAVCAALTVWAIMFAIPQIQEIPLGFRTTAMLGLWSFYELVPSVAAGLVAGYLYRDPPGA